MLLLQNEQEKMFCYKIKRMWLAHRVLWIDRKLAFRVNINFS